MFKLKIYLVTAVLGTLALVAGACVPTIPTTPTTPTTPTLPVPAPGGTLKVYVTDAPPRENVTSIMVTVTEVQVHMAPDGSESDNETLGENETLTQAITEGGEGGWLTIDLSDNATTFDLLQIRGIEQQLGTSDIASGKYTQVRLVVDKVQVKLGDGELQDAELPSKELKIVHPFNIVPGETTALVLDFDADKMVTVTGGGKIIVKPVIKLTVKQEKPSGNKAEEDEDEEEAGVQASVAVSCDNFTEIQHISREIEVNAGDLFQVTLCSNPTTGFQWDEDAQIDNETVVEQVKHRFISPESNPPPPPGSPGQETWTFKALEAGTTTISMAYSRPWEGGEKGEWTFQLTVTVK